MNGLTAAVIGSQDVMRLLFALGGSAMRSRNISGLVIAMLLVACGASDEAGFGAEVFHRAARDAAGSQALDCGLVAAGADRSETHCCLLSRFAESLPAFASYEGQGIDSQLFGGVAVRADASVMLLSYDSFDGAPDDGVTPTIEQRICENPRARALACQRSDGLPVNCANERGS